jgi:hypothetical protein
MKFGLIFAYNLQKKVAYEVGQYGSMKTFVRPQILLIDSRFYTEAEFENLDLR